MQGYVFFLKKKLIWISQINVCTYKNGRYKEMEGTAKNSVIQ